MFLQENAKFLQGIQYFCGKTLKVLKVNTKALKYNVSSHLVCIYVCMYLFVYFILFKKQRVIRNRTLLNLEKWAFLKRMALSLQFMSTNITQ